ncbi:MAG: DUF1499 domain-containing protein [Rhodocyclaceae bacterium]|nr:DUF1499 domain-containing protein [Rhodocyclaceae bacterium]
MRSEQARWLVGIAVALAGAIAMADEYRSCAGWRIGTDAVALPACPDRPNCVSGTLAAVGGQAPSLAEVARAALAEPRSRLELRGEQVLIASFRSRLFKFVDEAVFLRRGDGSIEYRCGACSGYYDFGVNARRMKRILARLSTATGEASR